MPARIDKTSIIDEHQVNVDHCFFEWGGYQQGELKRSSIESGCSSTKVSNFTSKYII